MSILESRRIVPIPNALIPTSNQKLFVVILSAAFSILRRIREAFWLCLGLVVVWREK